LINQKGETTMALENGKGGTSNFVWYELVTSDAKAAEVFYRGVVGWDADVQAGLTPGEPYTILKAGKVPVAGMLAMPKEFFAGGNKPGWIGYIGVDDVDGYTKRVQTAGGKVHRPVQEIPSVGRFSVVADPQGTVFVLFQPKAGADRPPQPPAGTPGFANWHELHAVDGKSAFEFYSGMFGWKKTEVMDMGPSGLYQMFAADGPTMGGMMTAQDQANRPGWVYYFNVDSADAAAERVKEKGGKVLMGPHEVPGGSWIVQGIDPQGALFAVVGPK
jgi:predicted enzyme related to lactoylglutathione lyase